MSTATIARVAEALARARRVLFITGAGISVDSGLPTYRGVGGLYHDVDTEDGMPIEEVLSGGMMARRPSLVWTYITQIERACAGAAPNAGHTAIAGLEERGVEVWVLTQNVDGLHQRAGSSRVIDIHGDLSRLRCTRCDHREENPGPAARDTVPTCPRCDAVLRPDVVLFDEMLPLDKLGRLQDEVVRGFDVTLSVGTSSLFPYVAMPVVEARRAGRMTVEINPSRTGLSETVDERLAISASEALSAIAR